MVPAAGGGKCWHPALDNLFEPLSLSKKAISLIFLLAFEGGKRYFPHTLAAFSLPFPEIMMISLFVKVSYILQPINRVRREVGRRILQYRHSVVVSIRILEFFMA